MHTQAKSPFASRKKQQIIRLFNLFLGFVESGFVVARSQEILQRLLIKAIIFRYRRTSTTKLFPPILTLTYTYVSAWFHIANSRLVNAIIIKLTNINSTSTGYDETSIQAASKHLGTFRHVQKKRILRLFNIYFSYN